MKTILVLTDFSKKSQETGELAIYFALKTGANILLFNAFISPPLLPAAEYVAWTSGFYTQFKEERTNKLKLEIQRLKEIVKKQATVQKQPAILFANGEESIASGTNRMTREHHISLIMMSSSIKTNGDFLFGNDLHEIISKVNYPILLVPEHQIKPDLKNIIFATDLDSTDMAALKYLIDFIQYFDARVHICHVTDPDDLVAGPEEAKRIFAFTDKVDKLKSSSVSYHNLEGRDIVKELEKYSNHIHADALSLVYKKSSLFWRIFHESPARKLLKKHNKLILVFPENFNYTSVSSALKYNGITAKRKRIPIL